MPCARSSRRPTSRSDRSTSRWASTTTRSSMSRAREDLGFEPVLARKERADYACHAVDLGLITGKGVGTVVGVDTGGTFTIAALST